MDFLPKVKIDRYEQLEPGELFSARNHDISFFALKCAKGKDADRNEMVVLGPNFPYSTHESFLLPWNGLTTISYGADFTVVLPTSADAWTESADERKPVCLAICKDELYICTNGAESPYRHYACYVHIGTGHILSQRLPAYALYTHDWDIRIPGPNNRLASLIKFPLAQPIRG
jgi:hypothetical protein